MANTHLGGAQHANVRLSSVRADAVPAHMRGSELEIRAALVAARDVAEGEELLLDYGLDLTRTTVRYALLNYGIVASLDAASFRQQSLPRDPEGSLLCAPLWCIDNAPDYAGMTAARHAHKFPERIEMLERLLDTAPWNATTVDDDLGVLVVCRFRCGDRRGLVLSCFRGYSCQSYRCQRRNRARLGGRLRSHGSRLGCPARGIGLHDV